MHFHVRRSVRTAAPRGKRGNRGKQGNPGNRGKRLASTAIAVLGLTALGLSGCASADQGAPASGGLRITVSTTQLADFTRQVVGDTGANLTQIVQPNQSAHDIEIDAATAASIENADVVIVNGLGLDHVISDAAPADKVVYASNGIALLGTDSEHGTDHGAEDAASNDGNADDHDHGQDDPHVWTAPENAKQQVATIADALVAADPSHADAYRANAQAYEAKLDTLNQWIIDTFAPIAPADRKFVSTHDAFAYFVHAYDIRQDDSVLGSLDDHAEPSESELQALVSKIRATGVKAVFAEASVDPKIVQRIAQEAGVTLYSGDNALYGDSLGTADSVGATYIQATVHNATLIGQSWGLTPSAPSGL